MAISSTTDSTSSRTLSDQLAWGFTLLAVAAVLNLIVTGYGWLTLSQTVDPEQLANQSPNALQSVIGCLSPLSFFVQLAGVILLMVHNNRLGGKAKQRGWIGMALYILSVICALASMPLAFAATTQGSLGMLVTSTWLSTAGTILGVVGVILVSQHLAPSWVKTALIVCLVLIAVSSIGSSYLTMSHVTMEKFEMMGSTYYFPKIDLDRTSGLYPLLVATDVVSLAVLMFAFSWTAITTWRALGSDIPEMVA